MNGEEVWLRLAVAAMALSRDTEHAAETADRMLMHWERRFGDAAFLLEGQTNCAYCQLPIGPGAKFESNDGIKYCNSECLKNGTA